MTVKATLKGYPPLVLKLSGAHLYGQALRGAMVDAKDYGERTAHKQAPVGTTGRLEAAISSRIDAREVPLFAAVEIPTLPTGTPTRGGRPFRYGFALSVSRRVAYHYRSGRLRGKLTLGWWTGIRRKMRGYLRRRLRKAAEDIKLKWVR